MSMTNEQYIEHEVQLRVAAEKFNHIDESIRRLDSKIDESVRHLDNKIDESIRHIDGKLNWMLGLIISSILLPVVLHLLRLI